MEYIHDRKLLDSIDRFCEDISARASIKEEKYLNIKRGLRNADGTGVLAGVTDIGSVQGYMMLDGEPIPMPGRLYYRGIDLREIIDAHIERSMLGFEEVSYLLLLGGLPTQAQLDSFGGMLANARQLPDGFVEDVLMRAPSANATNMLSRAILALYAYDPNPDDTAVQNLVRQSIDLIARVPVIVAQNYAISRGVGKDALRMPNPELSLAENFLYMLREDHQFTREEALLLDLTMTVYAEHGGGNTSAFACRMLSSTGTDTYGAVSGAISALKGPRDGGLNIRVLEMFDDIARHVPDWRDPSQLANYLRRVRAGEAGDGSGRIYGLGHAVYTQSDPRAVLLKHAARSLAHTKGYDAQFDLMEAIEGVGLGVLAEGREPSKAACANVDMYSGLVFRMLDIPESLYGPLFAMSRTASWCAHRVEEVLSGNRMMRPAYRSVSRRTDYVPIEHRG